MVLRSVKYMKKISWILVCPLFLNIMTFMRRFLYDSIFMFVFSFLVFFLSIYADVDKNRQTKTIWNILTAIVIYMSCALFVFNTEAMGGLALTAMLTPVMAGAALIFMVSRNHIGEAGH